VQDVLHDAQAGQQTQVDEHQDKDQQQAPVKQGPHTGAQGLKRQVKRQRQQRQAPLKRQHHITDVLSGLNRFMRQHDVGQGKRSADGVL
jgi:hypothetical protein